MISKNLLSCEFCHSGGPQSENERRPKNKQVLESYHRDKKKKKS